jgi:hypothetical protein
LVRSARSPKCFDDSHVVNGAALYSSFTLDLFGSFVFSIFSLALRIAALLFDFYLSVLWSALADVLNRNFSNGSLKRAPLFIFL